MELSIINNICLVGRNKLSVLFMVCLLMSVGGGELLAQTEQQKAPKTIPAKERWAVKTNALEWLLTVPNIGFEYDWSPSIYNRMTVGVTTKWNWNTHHNFKPSVVFNVFEVRPEFRYYWRTVLRQPRYDEDDTVKRSLKQWLKEDVFTNEREKPKYWRAYYVGGYVHGGSYSFKLGEKGKQGQMYGFGLTMGYGLPLYTYKKSVIDIELGFSLGLAFTKYDVYRHYADGNYYKKIENECKGLRVVPWVSELKVGFVYRRASIRDKYKKVDYVKQELKALKRDSIQAVRDSVKMVRDSARNERLKLKKEEKMGQDSVLLEKKGKPVEGQEGTVEEGKQRDKKAKGKRSGETEEQVENKEAVEKEPEKGTVERKEKVKKNKKKEQDEEENVKKREGGGL